MHFKPTDESLFFKSQKANDSRIGESVRAQNSQAHFAGHNHFAIVGYADDEGIDNNSGRNGARFAPPKIREFLYKMTPAARIESKIFDFGDLEAKQALAKRHTIANDLAQKILKSEMRLIALGGGHDYGYADVAAFAKTFTEKPLVINFDAHLDVRPTDQGINSGTPFFRVLEEFSDIDLVQVGIQSQCNSIAHFDYSNAHNVQIFRYDDIRLSGEDLTSYCVRRLANKIVKRRPCFISIDMDGFSNAYAPGVSQGFATGLQPDEFFQLFYVLLKRLDVRGIGIYECSPPLDSDDRTSKLAALIVHKFIYST